MFFNKFVNAMKAFRQLFTGEHGVANSFFNAARTATAENNVAIINRQLENTINETDKKQLEKELMEAQVVLNSCRRLMDENIEGIGQSKDRLSRILGTDAERAKHLFREKKETDCPLKNKGDRFELHVGRHFEKEGCFVFYNGMLRSEADQGVDLVAYNARTKVVRYIQCKNWEAMKLDFDEIMMILSKMSRQRISPTNVEIKRQQQAGWSNGCHFDDSVYYKTEYCLVVPKRESLTPNAIEKVGLWGSVSMPQGSGNPTTMQLYCFNDSRLETWFYL